MKTLLLIILFFINVQIILGQDGNDEKYRFAKEAFKSEKYKQDNYPRFDKEILRLENGVYQFGEKYLKIELEKLEYENIFKLGIFNPDIVFGKETTNKTKSEFDTLSQNQKVFYNLTRNDSLSICCVEELEKLNPNPRTKRFIFWLFRIGVANPTEYYFELYNQNATKKTSIEEFIENARMTFYYQGTMII
ncbi:hypothetical protein [Flavobacterium sp. JP2137]|uniref:hypothetical protein n=1 Tax=Flavobacterium sp. JP2137 TaxID=3414510 RepID=UPI003D300788